MAKKITHRRKQNCKRTRTCKTRTYRRNSKRNYKKCQKGG